MQSPDLTAAIDVLYEAFASYPRPSTFLACGCCWQGREVPGGHWNNTRRPLVEVDAPGGDLPLREVPASEELAELGTDVPLTGGDLALFKHYLPRLCEIIVGDGFDDEWPLLPLIGSRLSCGPDVGCEPWWNWPRHEQAAMQLFLDAVWQTARRGTLEEADDTLCTIGLAVLDFGPYLDTWLADPDATAAGNLQRYVTETTAVSAGHRENVLWWWTPDHEPGGTNLAKLIGWLNEQSQPA